MKNKIKILTIIFLSMLTLTTICKSQNSLDINNFTFNDSIINELTIEKVTDMLGRPSATNNNPLIPEVIKDIGSHIYYHDKGLSFWFKPERTDSQKRIMVITVYLVKTWDKDFNEFFLPYSGKINPSINSNMKSESLINLFAEYNYELKSAEEARKESEVMFKKIGINKSSDIAHDKIIIKEKNGNIVLQCEEMTKFLEYLSITTN